MLTPFFLISLFFAFVSAQNYNQVFKWERALLTNKGEELAVPEFSQVDTDRQLMLMSAKSELLRATPFYRSESLHDFVAGLVAVKPVGANVCLLGNVKQSYDKTLAELRRRQSEGQPASERRPMEATSSRRLTTSGSRYLDSFCKGLSFIRLADIPDGHPVPGPLYPFMCFWGPIDIYVNAEELVFAKQS